MFDGFIEGSWLPIKSRRIRLDACKMYGYRCAKIKDRQIHVADYRDHKNVIAQHIRYVDNKFFTWAGEVAAIRQLFGQHLWSSGGKKVVVAKGEVDTLTIAQAQGLKWPTVGIPGYTMANLYIKHAYEWLNSFEQIILAFDDTEAGSQTAEEIASLFPPGKVKTMSYGPHADANEMEMENAGDKIIGAVFGARDFRPDGIVMGSELWEEIIKQPPPGLDVPYPELNRRLRGFRTGNIFMLTAGSGLGKSTLAHELGWYMMMEHKQKLGVIALEEAIGKAGNRYVSKAKEIARGDFHINREGITEEQIRAAYDKTINGDHFCLYNHRGSKDVKTILSKIRFMSVALGMKWIVLDHVSIIVSGLTGEIGNDERKTLDVLMTEMSGLVEELDIGLIAVAHLKRKDGKPFNEGGKISLNDLRGTAGLEQLSHVVIGLERDQQDEDTKNFCRIRLLKDRDLGDTGLCDTLQYHPDTGRLDATEKFQFEDNSKRGGHSEFTEF